MCLIDEWKVEVWGNHKEIVVLSRFILIPIPQFHEIWRVVKNRAYDSHLRSILYDDNETERACQIWLELRKEGSL